MKFLNDVEITGSGADLSCAASVTFSGLSSSSQTTAVMINGSGVLSKRTLGSNAFNSTTIPTNTNQLTNGSGFLNAHPSVEIQVDGSNNSGRTYIQDITLDEYGHVTNIGTATETVTNTNTQNIHSLSFVDSGSNCILRNTRSGASSATQNLTFVAGSGISLTPSGSNLTIAASGGGGGDGNAGAYRGSYRPSANQTISSGGNTGVKSTVLFNTAVFTASGISINTETGEITITNTGIYQIAFNFASENANTANRLLVAAELQATQGEEEDAFETIPGTRVFNYNRGIQTGSGAASWGDIFEGSGNSTILHSFANANCKLRAQFWIDGRSTNASGAKTLIEGCRLSLHNIS
tara:strand:+ start:41 stop:1093 length:1053 start_codon:yes stop_codon:yes gene_type:complete